MTIHWCGNDAALRSGLSAVLTRAIAPVVIWADEPDAVAPLGGSPERIEPWNADRLGSDVMAGDVIVSAGGADRDLALATLAANKGAHLVTPGDMTPALSALEGKALLSKSSIVTEVGVSPGIDHLLARHLVHAYATSTIFDPAHTISLISCAGQVPAEPGPARAGRGTQAQQVWRALSAPARAIRDFREARVNLAWDADAVEEVTLPLPAPEDFELVPRGDALPLLDAYGIDPVWPVARLERGLLCPPGWRAAWGPVLSQIEALNAATPAAPMPGSAALTVTGGARIVIFVALIVERNGALLWHHSAVLEAVDAPRGSAHDRLLGRHVRLAIEALVSDEGLPAGVGMTRSDPAAIEAWLRDIGKEARHFSIAHR
ncbi:hypothetical protein [Pseudaestuariivita atlantica]|uniref:Saccharopine dehydrogenase-like C-terminal domain-containing protein n=1 Tax=Pseudaestuariivita atlantica TaxID=1317121 RepID=A0A0L1JRZ3_9RHOB|nr:hypothetical protein [Pseudaestuariivita atlantica]KNG94501.1 hypothetical protein ATO11_03520 [Pseudaestuariivita atlantica]